MYDDISERQVLLVLAHSILLNLFIENQLFTVHAYDRHRVTY